MNIIARLRQIRIIALILAALCLTTGLTTAGEMSDGYKLTLPVQAHWDSVTLPAGDYTFTLVSSGLDTRVLLKKEGNYVAVLLTTGWVAEKKSSGPAALTLAVRNGTYYVTSLFLPNRGMDLHYRAPKPEGKFVARSRRTPGAYLLFWLKGRDAFPPRGAQ